MSTTSKSIIKTEQIKDDITLDIVKALTQLGWEASLVAYRKKSFKNRTFNLHDSYASAVYVDGVLQERTIRYMGGEISSRIGYLRKSAEPKRKRKKGKLGQRYYRYGKSGREVLNTFFRGNKWYKGHSFGKKGIVLIVVAAMWYAGFLEGKGYKVVTDVGNQFIKDNLDKTLRPIYEKYGIPRKMIRFSAIARVDEDWYGADDFKYKIHR